jgi:hypothetical protein
MRSRANQHALLAADALLFFHLQTFAHLFFLLNQRTVAGK